MSVLLGWLWQGTALALAVAAALRLLPRVGAASRHAIWWFTLIAILGLPLCHLVPTLPASPGEASAATSAIVEPLLVPSLPDWAVAILIGAWLGTVVLGIARIGRGVAALEQLRLGALPVDPGLEERFPRWRLARGRGRRCELRASGAVQGACALGLWKPAIVVSSELLDALADDELEQVVLHEHAHLVRYDDWTRLAQAVVDAFAGLHPAVALAGRQIDIEREAACDDRVVAMTGEARRYAACLTAVGAASLAPRVVGEPTLLPGMARSRGTVLLRVRRLLDPRRGHGLRLAPSTGVVTMAALLLAVATSWRAGPMVDVVETGRAVDLPSPASRPPSLSMYLPDVPATAMSIVVAEPRVVVPPVAVPAALPAAQAVPSALPQRAGPLPSTPRELGTTAWQPTVLPAKPPSVAPAEWSAPPALATIDGNSWETVASSGAAIGTGGKKAGLALGSFFGRTAKAAGSAF